MCGVASFRARHVYVVADVLVLAQGAEGGFEPRQAGAESKLLLRPSRRQDVHATSSRRTILPCGRLRRRCLRGSGFRWRTASGYTGRRIFSRCGWLANLVRERHARGMSRSINVNRHINPTKRVCGDSCRLCAFGRKKGALRGYPTPMALEEAWAVRSDRVLRGGDGVSYCGRGCTRICRSSIFSIWSSG